MIEYPYLSEQPSGRETVDVFGGYNHNLRIGGGEFYDMENLTGDYYPVLSPRKRRAPLFTEEGVTGIAYDRGSYALLFTKGENLHLWSITNPVVAELGLTDSPKRFVHMGNYLIILPDMKYVSLQMHSDYGDVGATVEVNTGEAIYELCDAKGKVYSGAVASETEPENPENGALWIDISADPSSLKKYSSASGQWVSITSTYVRIKITEVDPALMLQSFRQYDGVTISGASVSSLNGSAIVWAASGGYIVVAGILDGTVTQDCSEMPLKIERQPPVMDYVVEAGNRLWGCRYGKNAEGELVNEIYASKLGDFRNWSCFMGLATDSWAASVGSEGPFTGAVNHGGNPVFYKENMKHKVWISETGAHQITSTPCQGVSGGSGSLTVINGTLYYKSRDGFCADDGSGPVEIGQAFGGVAYSDAVAVACRNKYYVSMKDGNDNWNLFVYDTLKKLWHREDGMHVAAFCYCPWGILAANADTGEVMELSRGEAAVIQNNTPLLEGPVKWVAETGPLGISSPDMKYISRLTLRLSMEAGAELTVYAQYDMEQEWVVLGSIQGTSLRSFSLPVRPRRCDHLRLRLEGVGDVKLYSITKTIEEGSDIS